MKTTSKDISQKLESIGFEAETNFYWQAHYIDTIDNSKCTWNLRYADGFMRPQPKYDVIIPGDDHLKEAYKAYDLETLWEFLSSHLGNLKLCATGELHFFYEEKLEGFSTTREEGDSIADLAGELLLWLVEEGIINLKE